MPTATLLLAFDPTDLDTTQAKSGTAAYGRFLGNGSSRLPAGSFSKVWQLAGFTGTGVTAATVANAGSGYTLGDTVAVTAGTYVAPAQFKVTAVSATGGVSGLSAPRSPGLYTAAMTQPTSVPVSGGTGTGATLALTFGDSSATTITVPDNRDAPILLSRASNIVVQVLVQAVNCSFTNGLVGANALQISVVFGRGRHHRVRNQNYAAPFAIPGGTNVCCSFVQAFTASLASGSTSNWTLTPTPAPVGYTQPAVNQAYVSLGAPTFLDSAGQDLFEFNVGVVAATTGGVYTFGHDPDMQVDN